MSIITFLQSDGTTALPLTERNGLSELTLRQNLIYNDLGGTATLEFILKNTSASEKALGFTMRSSQLPKDPEKGEVITDGWSFRGLNDTKFTEPPVDVLSITEIPPGGTYRVRWTVKTSVPNQNPAPHYGVVSYNYLRSTV